MKYSTSRFMKDVAFIIKNSGTMLGLPWVSALIEMIERAIFPDATQPTAEVKHWQSFLFGIYATADYPVYNGENRWECVEELGHFFGETHLGGRPSPPYNYVGYAELKSKVTTARMVRDSDLGLHEPSNKLLLGGDRILPEVAQRRLEYAERLPYWFVPADQLSRSARPADPPQEIQRYYFDQATGRHYRKTSITGKYLVDTRSDVGSPFGPFVSQDGRITRDVILLTILPGVRGHVVTLINPGYGAGARLGQLLTDGNILQELFRACRDVKQGDPWLQAVFTCSVDHSDETETYGPLELVPDSVVPLERS